MHALRFRKPELIPLLFILAAETLLVFLGGWQVERLEWKNTLLEEIAAAQRQAPLTALPQNIETLAYRSVELGGTYLPDKTLRKVGGKQGLPSGFFLLTPLKLGDGRAILVNRGFLPNGQEAVKAAMPVKGILRPAHTKTLFFLPDNQPQDNLWLYEDIAAMSKATDLTLLPMIVEATGTAEKGAYPVPGNGAIAMRNDHLGYAITWFSLAVIGIVLFGIYYREKPLP